MPPSTRAVSPYKHFLPELWRPCDLDLYPMTIEWLHPRVQMNFCIKYERIPSNRSWDTMFTTMELMDENIMPPANVFPGAEALAPMLSTSSANLASIPKPGLLWPTLIPQTTHYSTAQVQILPNIRRLPATEHRRNPTNLTAARLKCQTMTLQSENDSCEKPWSASQHGITGRRSPGAAPPTGSLAHILTPHHFYSLNEHAGQIPLKVQVTTAIQMPCRSGALVKQGPFPLPPWMGAVSLLPPYTSQTGGKLLYATYARY